MRPITHPLLRNHDLLGPWWEQMASISRMLQQSVLDAVARNNAVIGVAMAAAAKPQLSVINTARIAGITSPSVLSKSGLGRVSKVDLEL